MIQFPILYINKADCVGCSACICICPTSSITMFTDDEGFLYPVINTETCIKCFKCIKVCPVSLKKN